MKKYSYEEWKKYLILEGYRGSHAHGTYIPNNNPDSIDDIDTLGVAVLPRDYYLGFDSFFKHNQQYESFHGQYDVLIYEIKKFMYLLYKGNPNVVSLLWNRKEDILFSKETGKILIDNANSFLSNKMYKTFGGYAKSQLKKMTHFKFEGYMGKKRKSLVLKWGYDCKNAAHCIRLLKMGIELFNTGNLFVYRENDKEEIISIKTGKWKLEDVKVYADKLFLEYENAFKNSKLPAEPDYKNIEKILIEILELEWKNRN